MAICDTDWVSDTPEKKKKPRVYGGPRHRDFTPPRQLPKLAKGPRNIEEETVEQIARYIASGNTARSAAAKVGLAEGTVGNWLRKAAADRALGDDESTSRYIRWANKIYRAEGEYQGMLEDLLHANLERDPKLILEVLRRRAPIAWSEPAAQLEIKATKLSDEELDQKIEELKQAFSSKGLLKAVEAEVDAEVEEKDDDDIHKP